MYSSGFEGVNGATVQLADGPWSDIVGTPLYGISPAGVIDGTTCLHAQTFAADPVIANRQYSVVRRNVALTESYGRLYLYINQPSVNRNGRFFVVGTPSGGGVNDAFAIRYRPNGKMDFVDTNLGIMGETANVVPINKWMRVEWHITHGSPVGSVEVRFYIHDPNAVNPTETVNLMGDIPFTGYNYFGTKVNNPTDIDYYIDALVDQATTWVGAAGPPTFGAKVWNGSAWVDHTESPVWNGTSWVTSSEIVVWDGYQWVRVV